MSKFCTFFSGSSGNCSYVGYSGEGILIDAGVSAKKIAEALNNAKIDINKIKAILITHEHIDHVKGLRVFLSKRNVPVIASSKTVLALKKMNEYKNIDFTAMDGKCHIGSFFVESFKVSHDCADARGYKITLPDERKISVITDTGRVSDDIIEIAKGSDLVFLESNYDEHMLLNGSYPFVTKMRIASETGHLSNKDSSEAALKLAKSGATRIILCHISRNNNTEELALNAARRKLMENGVNADTDCKVAVAPQCGTLTEIL